MHEIEASYDVEFGRHTSAAWHDIIVKFDDANLYQTWSYDITKVGQDNVDHLVLRKGKDVVAAAQIRIIKLPVIGNAIAYIRWGPLWNLKGEPRNINVFQQALRALKVEYADRRKLLLTILPCLFWDEDQELLSLFFKEGFKEQAPKNRQRTLLLDLRPPLEGLRQNLLASWRNKLKQAENRQLEILEGDSELLFDAFIRLYYELVERKGFSEPNDIYEFKTMQSDLPSDLKMRVFLERSQNEFGSGAICSALGRNAVYLFGATNKRGLTNNGSYLIQWKILHWLKSVGCRWYDLNGINPVTNPGTYSYKKGLAGKNGRDTTFLGTFECYGTFKGFLVSKFNECYFNFFGKLKIMKYLRTYLLKKK
jgi:hypothetical protein